MKVHLHLELEKLKTKMLSYSAVVDGAIRKAVKALKERDVDLAEEVIRNDNEIDRMEVEIEEECLKLLALYGPVANDLRFIITVLKINNDMERIADQAGNMAERAKSLASQPNIEIPYELTIMCEEVIAMLEQTLQALINQDIASAQQVIEADDKIDALHAKMYSIVQSKIRGDIDRMDSYISILIISRYLERIADQITNIAEDVIYMVSGTIVRHTPTKNI